MHVRQSALFVIRRAASDWPSIVWTGLSWDENSIITYYPSSLASSNIFHINVFSQRILNFSIFSTLHWKRRFHSLRSCWDKMESANFDFFGLTANLIFKCVMKPFEGVLCGFTDFFLTLIFISYASWDCSWDLNGRSLNGALRTAADCRG